MTKNLVYLQNKILGQKRKPGPLVKVEDIELHQVSCWRRKTPRVSLTQGVIEPMTRVYDKIN